MRRILSEMLPEGTVGHLLLHGLDLTGREFVVEAQEASGRLRILGLHVEPRYAPSTPLDQLDDPHTHALALVVDTEVLDGDFAGVEQLGDAGGELRHEHGRVRHSLRVDPLRELSAGQWRHCSILLAESDDTARDRIEYELSKPGEPNVASRLARAAQPPIASESLARWFIHSMPGELLALPWADGTRVLRDGLHYTFELLRMQPEPIRGFTVIHKAMISMVARDAKTGDVRDVRQQELYFGGAIDWRWHALAQPPESDAVVRRWAEHQMASLRRTFAEHPEPSTLMPHDLPWASPLPWLLLEHGRNGAGEPRPRPIVPRSEPPSLETFERKTPGTVGRFGGPGSDLTIDCEVDNPWSFRLVLRSGDHHACLLDARSDGMNGDIRVIDRDTARVREVARWLYESALAAGNPIVTLPEEPNEEEEEDDDDDDPMPASRKPIGELLGFTPESELLDWRCVPDDISYADCSDEGTDVDEAGRSLWRRLLTEHFDDTAT